MTSKALLALLFLRLALGAQTGPTHLVYGVEVEEEGKGGYRFTVEVTNPPEGPLAFVAPYFAPGAYRPITVEPRSGPLAWTLLADFEAVDEKGAARAVRPDGERRWVVDGAGARRLTLRYRDSAPSEESNNRSFLTRTSGLIDGPRSWLYLEGAKDLPVHVHFRLPEGWQIATGLDPTFDPAVFTAKDYDRLIDCPTLIGAMTTFTFQVRGVPHRIALEAGGRPVRVDEAKLVSDLERIVTAFVELFDDVPYEHYTFIYVRGGGGGLEHLTSTTIGSGPQTGVGRLTGIHGITAHEFFHAWNVKRLRPLALGPFDYRGPIRVKDLWICEGLTSYYAEVGLLRAGLKTGRAFVEGFRAAIDRFENDGDHWQHVVSPEEASWTVWDPGSRLSYYLQGEVLGLALDLAIREGSDNRKSLDDAMRRLYRDHGGYYRHHPPRPGFRSEEVVPLIQDATGVDLADFFARHVSAAEPVPWAAILGAAGWQLVTEEEPVSALAYALDGETEDGPRLEQDGRSVIVRAPEGSELGAAGFEDGDVLVSVGGRAVASARRARAALRAATPGEPLSCEIQRKGAARTIDLAARPVNEAVALWLEEQDGRLVITGVPTVLSLHRQGLRRGDVLRALDGTALPSDPAAAARRLAALAPGREVAFTVQRDGRDLEIKATPAPLVRRRITEIRDLESPTPRQLAIRAGLLAGSREPAPATAPR